MLARAHAKHSNKNLRNRVQRPTSRSTFAVRSGTFNVPPSRNSFTRSLRPPSPSRVARCRGPTVWPKHSDARILLRSSLGTVTRNHGTKHGHQKVWRYLLMRGTSGGKCRTTPTSRVQARPRWNANNHLHVPIVHDIHLVPFGVSTICHTQRSP